MRKGRAFGTLVSSPNSFLDRGQLKTYGTRYGATRSLICALSTTRKDEQVYMRRRLQLRFMPGLGNAVAESSVFRRAVLFLVCLLVLCPVIRAERLPMKLYTTDDGLRTGGIDYIMRDSRGFIWFCTRDGLSRFDGYRFVNYKIGDTASAQSFTYMFETRKGIFWIAMGSGATYRFDPNATGPAAKPQFPTSGAGDDGRLALNAELVSSDFAGVMYEDQAGNLWAGGRTLFLVEEHEGRVSGL